MARTIIISCAVTGGADTKGINPNVPITPKEIADEVLAANTAGAAVAHVSPASRCALQRIAGGIRAAAPCGLARISTSVHY